MPGVLTCDLSSDEKIGMRSPSRSRSDTPRPSSCTPSEPAEDMVIDRGGAEGGGGGGGGSRRGSTSPSGGGGGVFPRLSALASPTNLYVPQLSPRRISLNGLWDAGGGGSNNGGGVGGSPGQKEERRHSHPTTLLSSSASSSELPIQIDFSFPVTELRVPERKSYCNHPGGGAGDTSSSSRGEAAVCVDSVGGENAPEGREAPSDPGQESSPVERRKPHSCNISEDASQVECSLDDGGHTRSEPPVAREPHFPVEPSSRSPAKSLHHTISPNKHSTGQPGGPGTQSPDVIPTDLSDTTESEANNSIVAGEIVVCPNASSHHLGRELMNAVYSLPVDTVFTLIFANSKFMLDIYTARKTYDVVSSPWQSNSDTNQKLRQVTYTMTLPPNSFGPKVSHVTETQVVSPFSKPGEMYTVDVEACNAGIPYADSFYISNHWCLTRESSSETRVSVWTQVKYKKNVWGFMKGVIDKNAYIGIESLMQDMNAALLVEVDRSNQKRTRRRRRRAGSKVETADSTNPSQAEKGKDMHKSTQIPSRKMLTMQSACLETSAAPAEGPIRIVLLTLIGLLVVNALLYYRLWALEEKVNYPSSSMHSFPALDPNIFRQGSGKGSWEDWVAILHQQEAQHSTEIERWRKSIEEAARFLKQFKNRRAAL